MRRTGQSPRGSSWRNEAPAPPPFERRQILEMKEWKETKPRVNTNYQIPHKRAVCNHNNTDLRRFQCMLQKGSVYARK